GLGPLEALQAVQGQGLGGELLGPEHLVKEQAMPAEPRRLAGYGLGRDFQLAGQLAVGDALRLGPEDPREELGTLEPVGGAERLLTEGAPAVNTVETLDAVRLGLAAEEAVAHPTPASGWAAVECALVVGTERGRL